MLPQLVLREGGNSCELRAKIGNYFVAIFELFLRHDLNIESKIIVSVLLFDFCFVETVPLLPPILGNWFWGREIFIQHIFWEFVIFWWCVCVCGIGRMWVTSPALRTWGEQTVSPRQILPSRCFGCAGRKHRVQYLRNTNGQFLDGDFSTWRHKMHNINFLLHLLGRQRTLVIVVR